MRGLERRWATRSVLVAALVGVIGLIPAMSMAQSPVPSAGPAKNACESARVEFEAIAQDFETDLAGIQAAHAEAKAKQRGRIEGELTQRLESFVEAVGRVDFPEHARVAADALLEQAGRELFGAQAAGAIDIALPGTTAAIADLRAVLAQDEPCLVSASPGASPPSSLDAGCGGAPGASPPASAAGESPSSAPCPAHTVAELLAPPEAPVDAEAVFALYAPSRMEQVDVIDFGDSNGGQTPEGETIEVPILSEIGAAAHLCAEGSPKESAEERLLERQRGCFVALAGEWNQYLMQEPGPEAEARFAAARSIFGLASDVLTEEGRSWLETALTGALATTREGIPVPDSGPALGKTKVDKLLTTRTKKPSGVRLLRAIRDAVAADPTHLLPGVRHPDVWADSFYSSAVVGWLAANIRKESLVHVSRPGMCLHDLNYLLKVPKDFDVSGISLIEDRSYACWNTLVAMWEAYKATGSEAYFEAAREAWAMLSAVDPQTASYAVRKHRFNSADLRRLR